MYMHRGKVSKRLVLVDVDTIQNTINIAIDCLNKILVYTYIHTYIHVKDLSFIRFVMLSQQILQSLRHERNGLLRVV